MVVLLELLRRLAKEFDRYLVRKRVQVPRPGCNPRFKPTIVEQAIRAFLYTLQFVVAYFVMLYVGSPQNNIDVPRMLKLVF